MKQVAFYLLAHQPRRLRLPTPDLTGLPVGAMLEAAHDDAMNRRYLEQAAERAYRPVLAMLRESGWPASVAVTDNLLWQARRWAPDLAPQFSQLPATVERVGTAPRHGFLFLLDPAAFRRAMRRERGRVTDTTEMWLSGEVAQALRRAGCLAALADQSPELGVPEGQPLVRSLVGLPILLRHRRLSDDVGYRFSDRNWTGWPLTADGFARRLREAPGEVGLVGWDMETFGEHHQQDGRILEFLYRLPLALERAGVETVGASAIIRPGPELSLDGPVTWAGTGNTAVFFGNRAQKAVWQLLEAIWSLAASPRLKDAALWFSQSDAFHMLHWTEATGSLADVSAYFTPEPWRQDGGAAFSAQVVAAYTAVRDWFRTETAEGGPSRSPGR